MSAETPKKHRQTRTRRPAAGAPLRAGRICTATKKDGTPCRTFARTDSPFCLSHDPTFSEQLLEAQRRGGRTATQRRMVPPGEQTIELHTAEDVRALVSLTVDKLQKGALDRNIASTTLYAAQIVLKAIDIAALESRIAALEAARQPKAKAR